VNTVVLLLEESRDIQAKFMPSHQQNGMEEIIPRLQNGVGLCLLSDAGRVKILAFRRRLQQFFLARLHLTRMNWPLIFGIGVGIGVAIVIVFIAGYELPWANAETDCNPDTDPDPDARNAKPSCAGRRDVAGLCP
jgi:hypothetical protein